MLYKIALQHVEGVMGFKQTTLVQIYQGIFQW